MPTNLLNVVVTGRLLERRFNLPSRQAFTFAFLPSVLNLGPAEAMAVSFVLGRRNAVEEESTVVGPVEPAEVQVPELKGQTVGAAERMLKEKGLAIDAGGAPESAKVASQDPQAGSTVPAGSKVKVVVAAAEGATTPK